MLRRKPIPRKPMLKTPRKRQRTVTKDGRTILKGKAYTELRQKVWDRDGGICQVCFRGISWDEYEMDHVRPRGIGGGFRDDTLENCRVTCRSCNQAKGSKHD